MAAGYYGVVWVVRSDLDYLAKGFHLPHYGRRDPCCFCPANDTDMPTTDFRPTAAWRGAIYSADVWRATAWASHPLFQLPGLSILVVAADLMHCKHLGTDMYVFGSVLWVLCYDIMPGPRISISAGCVCCRNCQARRLTHLHQHTVPTSMLYHTSPSCNSCNSCNSWVKVHMVRNTGAPHVFRRVASGSPGQSQVQDTRPPILKT